MSCSPVLGEVSAEGGGEDGALELVEQGGQAIEAGLRGAGLFEDGVELSDDAALPVRVRPDGGRRPRVRVGRVVGLRERRVDGRRGGLRQGRPVPAGFADALERLLGGDVDLAETGRRGMSNVLRYFRLASVLPKVEHELERAAARRMPPAGSGQEVYRMAVLAEKLFQVMLQDAYAA